MANSYREPFTQLQAELERMLGTAFASPGSPPTGVFPPVNVFDRGDGYVVKAEIPGVAPEALSVDVEESTVTLRGERSFRDAAADAAFHRREREQGQFRRVIRMPGRVASDEARATYRDGVLTLQVPKAKETRPRRLTVEAV